MRQKFIQSIIIIIFINLYYASFSLGEVYLNKLEEAKKAKEEGDIREALEIISHFILTTPKDDPKLKEAYKLWKELWNIQILGELKPTQEKPPAKKEEINRRKLPKLKEKELKPEKEITLPPTKIFPLKEEISTPKETTPQKEVKKELSPELIDLNIATKLFKDRLYEEAQKEWSDFIKEFPKSEFIPYVFYSMVYTAFLQGNYDLCLSKLDELKELKVEKNSLYVLSGRLISSQIMRERGEYSTAIRELLHLQSIIEEESIPQLPTYRKIEENSFAPALPKEEELAAEIGFYLAENYFNQRLHQKAIEEYKKVILQYSTSPFAATASYKVAEIYDKVLEIRDFEKAAEAYFLFFSKYPNHPWSKEAEKRYYFIKKNYL